MLQKWPPPMCSNFWSSNLAMGLGPIARAVQQPPLYAKAPNLSNLSQLISFNQRQTVLVSNGLMGSRNTVNNAVTNRLPFNPLGGLLRMGLAGVTYDTNGAASGLVRILFFRTGDNSFVAETTSDANGVWALDMMKGGPFFQVCYKVGAPDVAGTSVNTLVPVQILI